MSGRFGSFEPPLEFSELERRLLAMVVDGRTRQEMATAVGVGDTAVRHALRNAAEKIRLFASV